MKTLLFLLLPVLAHAQTPSCTVETSDLNFGTYNPIESSDKRVTGDFKFICTKDFSYNYKIVNSGYLTNVANGKDKLYYKFMLGPTNSRVGNVVTSGYDQNIAIVAAMKSGQYVMPGVYAGDIVFEINY